jgi:glycerol kinase
MAYWLGVDQGTSQTTAVVVDEQGQVVARHAVKVPVRFPQPGWVEQEPWQLLATVRQAVAPLLDRYPIQSVGFDNQGETFLLWDAATGAPATPAIVWQDKRAVPLCLELMKEVDARRLQRKTGLLLDSYFCAPKLRFLFEQNEALRQAAQAGKLRFGTTESWVLWQLSGGKVHVTDPSTASRTLLFDINSLQWDDELLALFQTPRALLPEVVPSAGFVGEIEWGNGHTLPLHALLVDQQAALFGQACFAAGDMKCTLGTGAFLLMNTGPAVRLSDQGLLSTIAWTIDGVTSYALDGGDFTAGAAVEWLVEKAGLLSDAAASEEIAVAAQEAGDSEVIFVPALAGLAAPHWLSEARGAFFGISRATTQNDLVRAVLDGIVWRIYDLVQAMQADAGVALPRLKVDGGPTANRYLMQNLADILQMEIHVAANEEATAAGIAQLAAHAASGVSLQDLSSLWRAQAVYAPRIGADQQQERRQRWQQAIAAVKHFHGSIQEGSGHNDK